MDLNCGIGDAEVFQFGWREGHDIILFVRQEEVGKKNPNCDPPPIFWNRPNTVVHTKYDK